MLVRVAIQVVFAVGLVVVPVVADQVAQGEAVVRGDVVDAGGRTAVVVAETVAGAGNTAREFAQRHARAAAIVQPEAAHAVAVAVVPLLPAGREIAELVAAGADVPRFGYQAPSRQHRVGLHGGEEAAGVGVAVRPARQHRREVEAEAVHVHVVHPVPQRADHHLDHARLRQVQAIAATGPVGIARRVVRLQHVVLAVAQPAEGQRGPVLVGFGTVVEHHVEDHLDPGAVQLAHHRPELVAHARRIGRIARFRREIADARIPPVIAQAEPLQAFLVGACVHGQQRDGIDPQRAQVADEGRMRQPRIGAAQGRRHVRMQAGGTLDVDFVQREVFGRVMRRPVAVPREWRGLVADARLQRHRRVVARVGQQRRIDAMAAIQVEIGRPAIGVEAVAAHHLARPRVEQQLGWVEAQTMPGCPRPMRAQAVDQPGTGALQPAMPDAVAAGREGQPAQLVVAAGIEHAQFERFGLRCPHREVDAGHAARRIAGFDGGSQRPVATGHQRADVDAGRGVHGVSPASATSISVANGGKVSSNEAGWPWAGSSRLSWSRLYTSLPP